MKYKLFNFPPTTSCFWWPELIVMYQKVLYEHDQVERRQMHGCISDVVERYWTREWPRTSPSLALRNVEVGFTTSYQLKHWFIFKHDLLTQDIGVVPLMTGYVTSYWVKKIQKVDCSYKDAIYISSMENGVDICLKQLVLHHGTLCCGWEHDILQVSISLILSFPKITQQ